VWRAVEVSPQAYQGAGGRVREQRGFTKGGLTGFEGGFQLRRPWNGLR